MEPFARRGLGELWLAGMRGPLASRMVRSQGVADPAAMQLEDAAALVHMLRLGDGGRAFLKIMRGFERTPEKQQLYVETLRGLGCPKQVIWGADDSALTLEREGEAARRAAGVERVEALPGRHFVQYEQAAAIAERIRALARSQT
jgi:haloalkane dehalogenase